MPNSYDRVFNIFKKVGHREGKGIGFESRWKEFSYKKIYIVFKILK